MKYHNVLDSNFVIDIEPYLTVIKEIKADEYSVPVYLVDVNKLVDTIVRKIAQTTALCTKYNYNPTMITYFIQVFETINEYSIDTLNVYVERLLKYKDLGLIPLLYPTKIVRDNDIYETLKYPAEIYINNARLVLTIITKLVKSDIPDYLFKLDDEYIYIHSLFIDGIKKTDKADIHYKLLYPIEIKFIDYLIKQGMKEPKNISIKEDNGKYLISWEY
jgi:hypothetical protein